MQGCTMGALEAKFMYSPLLLHTQFARIPYFAVTDWTALG